MPRKYYHSHPTRYKKKPKYSALFNNEEDKAKMTYNRDMRFRKFVNEWNADCGELLAWTLTDFYLAYQANGVMQLKLALA